MARVFLRMFHTSLGGNCDSRDLDLDLANT